MVVVEVGTVCFGVMYLVFSKRSLGAAVICDRVWVVVKVWLVVPWKVPHKFYLLHM